MRRSNLGLFHPNYRTRLSCPSRPTPLQHTFLFVKSFSYLDCLVLGVRSFLPSLLHVFLIFSRLLTRVFTAHVHGVLTPFSPDV